MIVRCACPQHRVKVRYVDVMLIIGLAFAFYAISNQSLTFTVGTPIDLDTLNLQRQSGDPLKRIGYVILVGAAFAAFRTKPRALGKTYPGVRLAAIVTVGWIAGSAIWGEMSTASTKDLIAALILWASCGVLVCRLGMYAIRVSSIIYTGSTILIGIVCEVMLSTWHPFSAEYRFSGTVYPNVQGVFCAIFIICMLSMRAMSRVTKSLQIGACVTATALLLLTQSRDSVLSLVVAYLVLCLRRWPAVPRRKIAAILVVFILATSVAAFLGQTTVGLHKLVRVVTLDRDTVAGLTIGGTREEIWRACMPFLMRKPFFGYGYGSFWSDERIEDISDKVGFLALHAHNGYLDTALNTGLIGCICLTALLVIALNRCVRETRNVRKSDAEFSIAIIVFFLVHLLFENYLATSIESILTVCVIAYLGFAGTQSGLPESNIWRESGQEIRKYHQWRYE